ncbi:hypothetical protein PAL_GLEAN10004690 [Pteropus alecto]|uniref:Uncharacterized protein n=1 Tax=Pteropus alecto TaxID=9402 RepID=L5KZE8_PTEAL|nr:hypothetical protein PAL_GLEAN10004690 [Pteropus alecto]
MLAAFYVHFVRVGAVSALKCDPSVRDASVWSCHGNGTEDAQDTVRGPFRAGSPRGATSGDTQHQCSGAMTVPLSRQHRTELRGAGRTRIPALEERQSAGCHRWKRQPGHGAGHGQRQDRLCRRGRGGGESLIGDAAAAGRDSEGIILHRSTVLRSSFVTMRKSEETRDTFAASRSLGRRGDDITAGDPADAVQAGPGGEAAAGGAGPTRHHVPRPGSVCEDTHPNQVTVYREPSRWSSNAKVAEETIQVTSD